MKKIILIILITFLNNCSSKPSKDTVHIDQAVEILCPGTPPALVLRVSKEEVRKALRKQFSHQNTRNTVLKLPNHANVIIPHVRPRDLHLCIIRERPKIRIPASMGY